MCHTHKKDVHAGVGSDEDDAHEHDNILQNSEYVTKTASNVPESASLSTDEEGIQLPVEAQLVHRQRRNFDGEAFLDPLQPPPRPSTPGGDTAPNSAVSSPGPPAPATPPPSPAHYSTPRRTAHRQPPSPPATTTTTTATSLTRAEAAPPEIRPATPVLPVAWATASHLLKVPRPRITEITSTSTSTSPCHPVAAAAHSLTLRLDDASYLFCVCATAAPRASTGRCGSCGHFRREECCMCLRGGGEDGALPPAREFVCLACGKKRFGGGFQFGRGL